MRRAGLGLGLALVIGCAWSAEPVLAVESTVQVAQEPARGSAKRTHPIRVGTKLFTESVLLGTIVAELLRTAGFAVELRAGLGGTRVLWNALRTGAIDVYPEYTGTLLYEIFADRGLAPEALDEALAQDGIRRTRPLGFENNYALGMLERRARELGIERISDLGSAEDLRFGLTNEFLSRADGWPGLRRRYGLAPQQVRGLDHDLAYRGLAGGDLDVIDLYSTDAEIAYYDIRVLEDDLGYFPRYEAVLLFRESLARTTPGAVRALRNLEGALNARSMRALNAAVKLERRDEGDVAREFLRSRLQIEVADRAASSRLSRLARYSIEHAMLVAISLSAAIALAVPLGILAARRAGLGTVVLGCVGIVQTIPSLALLVFMIPLLGIGERPALAALFLYSLLPIVRNTHSGLTSIDRTLIQCADAMGLPPSARLRHVELPLAFPSIIAGIKTAAVINVGTATLGALIGAGGYGEPILTGIRLDDIGLILEGAVPAALMALGVQALFGLVERRLVAAPLRSAITDYK